LPNPGLSSAAIESNQTVISATLDTSVYIRALHFGGPATVIVGHARGKLLALDNRVSPTETLCFVKEDPADNRILECAAVANSGFIVSEDKDLLRLNLALMPATSR
jgi:hypothetical protein